MIDLRQFRRDGRGTTAAGRVWRRGDRVSILPDVRALDRNGGSVVTPATGGLAVVVDGCGGLLALMVEGLGPLVVEARNVRPRGRADAAPLAREAV